VFSTISSVDGGEAIPVRSQPYAWWEPPAVTLHPSVLFSFFESVNRHRLPTQEWRPMVSGPVHALANGTPSSRNQPGRLIVEEAEERMRQSSYLELRRIVCHVHEGVLTLIGRVSSYYLRQVAQASVLGLDGIEAIDNRLEVVPARLAHERFAAT
jgi:hypothetical protein